MTDARKVAEEIVTDAELVKASGNANFGSRSLREVLARGVLQTAAGFHTGGTLRAIMRDLGLITDPLGHKPPNLRKKGRAYLWAVYGEHALTRARLDALEEAAQIADGRARICYGDMGFEPIHPNAKALEKACRQEAEAIAAAIRKLGGERS